MLKQFVQQGRRRVETGGVPSGYVEDFGEPRTKLADCFSILLELREIGCRQGLIRGHLVKRHLHAPLPLPIHQ